MRRILAVLLVLATPAMADDFSPSQRQAIVAIVREALQRDPSILRDALVALQADDAKKHDEALRGRLAALGPRLVDAADPVEGNPQGDVTLIEFYDTRCPYCRAMEPVLAELLRGDSRVKLVLKDLPVLGANSQLESRALLAAQKQGGYFKLRPAVMALSGTTTRDTLRDLADKNGLDGARLLRDMDDPAVAARLQANVALAQQLGLDGTPGFIAGARLIEGAVDLPELKQAVAAARKP